MKKYLCTVCGYVYDEEGEGNLQLVQSLKICLRGLS